MVSVDFRWSPMVENNYTRQDIDVRSPMPTKPDFFTALHLVVQFSPAERVEPVKVQ